MIKISKIFLFSADIDFQIISLGTGQNLSGILDGIIDRGAKTFFRKKSGRPTHFSKMIRVGGDFSSQKFRGAKTFFTIKFENPRFH